LTHRAFNKPRDMRILEGISDCNNGWNTHKDIAQ